MPCWSVSGDFDVILHVTARRPNSSLQEMGQTVFISIVMEEGNDANAVDDFTVPPLPLFEESDDVPGIIVVPVFDWPHPDEGIRINIPYPVFPLCHYNQSPDDADSWMPPAP